MRALVTGSSGFIGSAVAAALVADGHDVYGFARRADDRAPLGLAGVHCGDLCDERAVARAVRGCEAVFHVAARYSYRRADRADMREINVRSTANVLRHAREAGVSRVVLTSSAATCGPAPGRIADERDHPPRWELTVPYKESKCAAERLALQAAREGQDVVVVNPATVLGPGDRRPTPSGKMVRDVIAGRMWGYAHGMGLCVVDVEDVAAGHLLAHVHGSSGERYILGGDNVELRDLFARLARHAGVSEPRIPVPRWGVMAAAQVSRAIAAAGGREPELVNYDEARLSRLPQYFSSARAERELGYRSRGVEAIVERAADWALSRLPSRGRPRLNVLRARPSLHP